MTKASSPLSRLMSLRNKPQLAAMNTRQPSINPPTFGPDVKLTGFEAEPAGHSAHHQHGTSRMTHHPFGDTADHHPIEAGATLAAHDDKIGLFGGGKGENDIRGRALSQKQPRAYSRVREFAAQRLQLFCRFGAGRVFELPQPGGFESPRNQYRIEHMKHDQRCSKATSERERIVQGGARALRKIHRHNDRAQPG